MLHEILFVAFYLGLLPLVVICPFVGVLIYYWLDWLPPGDVYMATQVPQNLSFTMGALTFLLWIFREKKTIPHSLPIMFLMAGMFVWINITSFYALVPAHVDFLWIRTVKVIGFAILTAQMMSTRARIDGFIWALVLAVAYFAIPGAIKAILSGGSSDINEDYMVTAANGSIFGDRVTLSVVLAMTLPFALYLRRNAAMLPARWQRWTPPVMLGVTASFLIASLGTFARTAVFASGTTLVLLGVRSRRKIAAIIGTAAVALLLLTIAPAEWFDRMNLILHYRHDASAMSRISAWQWSWQFAESHPIFGGGFGAMYLDAGHIYGQPGWLEAHNIFFSQMAQQGFVGLALFCGILFATHRSCAVIRKRSRESDDLAWTGELARAVQISLAAYVAGGMFVSIETTPLPYILAALAVGMRSVLERELGGRTQPTLAANIRPAAQPGE
jgi:putative inorganic carbon (hco3(-)) transporter